MIVPKEWLPLGVLNKSSPNFTGINTILEVLYQLERTWRGYKET